MVSKKTNKILQKDINLLLNKLITIIRKISNSCGNKNKKIKGGGGVGRGLLNQLSGNSSQSESKLKETLKDSIESFLRNEYVYSKKFIKEYYHTNINNILTNLKSFFAPNLKNTTTDKVIFNNSEINQFLQSYNANILENIRTNNGNFHYRREFSGINYDILFFKGINNDLNYIALNQQSDQQSDQDTISEIVNEAYNYYRLYIYKYGLLDNNDLNNFNDFPDDIAYIISSWILKFNPQNDMLILYYNFSNEITKILNDEIFDTKVIIFFFVSIQYNPINDFYKHLAILNMGITMKLINVFI
jgi:hypothetical protein